MFISIITSAFLIGLLKSIAIVCATWIVGILLKKIQIMYVHVSNMPMLLKHQQELKDEIHDIKEELKSKASLGDLELYKAQNALALSDLKNEILIDKNKKLLR